jgi:hypothetical protein
MTRNSRTGDYFLCGDISKAATVIGNEADDEQIFFSKCHLTGRFIQNHPPIARWDDSRADDTTHSTLKSAWTRFVGFSCDGLQ